ncbi:NAD(P)-binding protein [Dichomitus squalens LYAD-421 SS1]|uniref:NAD(P)-binding protein n=1 Tax=Dichomitus squalens (strain LYAD-421) TaxID=732165 RepID=R7SK39_DICSQ|nr:NAD(P)-binding protein [Dichomitus squalens LYAD-421 SS1]EJF56521.1 NAD(P)-binding protein [Dichomitus squalens LYAD-421 SS1]
MPLTLDATTLNALAVLGVILALPHLYRLLDFLWLYFLRPDSVKRYLHGRAPYAIVTGATDGIGKATAAELLARGFNVVLHGRNEAKMQQVVRELRAQGKGKGEAGERDIRYFIADAAKAGHDFAKLVEPFGALHVTIVVHNVGGSDLSAARIDGHSEDYILGVVNKNSFFSLFLTRALLPQLRRAAQSGPVQVFFVGSLAGDIAPVRLPIYAASKGFLESLARGLDNDEQFLGVDDRPTGVRFGYLSVGAVHSDNHDAPMPPSLTTPTSARFARALVDAVGCGRRRVAPYWVHAVLSWLVELGPESVADAASAQEMRGLIARAEKGK